MTVFHVGDRVVPTPEAWVYVEEPGPPVPGRVLAIRRGGSPLVLHDDGEEIGWWAKDLVPAPEKAPAPLAPGAQVRPTAAAWPELLRQRPDVFHPGERPTGRVLGLEGAVTGTDPARWIVDFDGAPVVLVEGEMEAAPAAEDGR